MHTFGVVLAAGLIALASLMSAQTLTGSVSGTVVDASGVVIAGAKVQLTHIVSGQTRDFSTNAAGAFEFSSLIPGAYSVRVVQAGFKTYEQQNVTVSAQERVDLHTIKLTVGDVATSIEVQAEVAHLATNSSDRSKNVNLAQIADTPVRGRDFMGF